MKFLSKSVTALSAALVLCGLSTAAFAADDLTVTLGTKVWANKWTSWDYYAPFQASPTVAVPGASESFTSSNHAAIIPALTVRYQDYLVTGSLFAQKEYGFIGTTGQTFTAKRDETDLHAGYFLLPTLAVTLGYKEVKQDFGPNSTFKYSGPMVGLVGSAPLTKGYSLYGNFGYGAMTANFPNGFKDNAGNGSLPADYFLSEVGFAYSFDAKAIMPAAKAITATVGYRNQTLATKDFAVGTDVTAPSKSRSTELRDNTEGLSFGLSLTF
jgi:hypothetical protein